MTDQFFRDYQAALATQDWAIVEPLIHPDACVMFSDGSVHEGRDAVGAAFRANFAAITDENYQLSNVRCLRRTSTFAVCIYDFAWTGRVGGRPARGAGRGSCVLVDDGNGYRLLLEHLGPWPQG